MVTFLKLLLKQGIMGSPTPSYSGKSIQIISTQQPNRILIHKPILIRLVIPEEVVVELCLTVSILVLQAEGLVCAIRKSWFPLSDDPSWCILRTTTDCRPYRSSLSVYRLGRNRSSGLVGRFRFLRWSSCVPVRISHALCQDWKFHAGYNLLIHLHKHHHSFEKKNLTKTILFHWKPIFPVVL